MPRYFLVTCDRDGREPLGGDGKRIATYANDRNAIRYMVRGRFPEGRTVRIWDTGDNFFNERKWRLVYEGVPNPQRTANA